MGPGIVAGLRGGTRPLGVLTGTGVSWIICGCKYPHARVSYDPEGRED